MTKPLRVLLVGNYALDRQESMHRFAGLMQDGLRQAGHQVKLLRPPVLMGRLKNGNSGLGKWLAYLDKFFFFPGLLRAEARRADVVHICDHGYAMFAGWVGATPSVVTCHDMLAVRGAMGEQTDIYPSATGHYLQRWIVRGLRRAKVIVSDSSATAADVQRIIGGKPAKKVILLSLNYRYQKLRPEEAVARLVHLTELDTAKPYVLHVGHNHPRKNRPCVIRAFARASRETDLQLVLAGPPLTPELLELIDAQGIADRVTVIVKPSNEVLEALYNLALALLFPSRFEGFGWPLIEAQACGCPVICSRCAPFAEIVGDSAICRNVEDERGFAEEILRLARDDGERGAWSEAGLRNAQRFTPAQMIARYIEAYRELLLPQHAENGGAAGPGARPHPSTPTTGAMGMGTPPQ